MSVPRPSRSRWVIALTAPCVPIGMKTGVSTVPWAVVMRPRRARPSVCVTRKLKGNPDMRREQTVYNLIEDAELPPDRQNTQALFTRSRRLLAPVERADKGKDWQSVQ